MKEKTKGRIDLLLLGIIALSAFLNFYQLTKSGSNTYYTVAVKSMLTSFHAFFYASFDPVGFITVDKPPVALWIQTLSAWIFGVSDFSVILPEALAGVVSVWLLYVIVKPKFGRSAALLSSLVLACTPIFVAVVRTNNVDSILILTLLCATWALMKAVDKQKISWLLLSVVLVGIGFNIKMLQAFMVLPAFYLFYFMAVKAKWTKKIAHLAIATVVLAVVSLSWAVTVDSISKDKRPYIGSSQTNSVLELAFGYNGISRLTGNKGAGDFGQGMPNRNFQGPETQSAPQDLNGFRYQNGTNTFAPGQRGGGMFGTGKAGVLRLFEKELSGQTSWLLPFALFAVIGVFASFRKKQELTMQHHVTILWLVWLLPMMVFFSIAQFFHQYYLSMMGPAISALTGIGWTSLWKLYKEKQGWQSWLLPTSVFVTSLFEAVILFENSSAIGTGWIILPIFIGIVLSGILVFMQERDKASYYLSLAGVLSLLIFPFYWTLYTVLVGGNSSLPVAGPTMQQDFMRGGPMGGNAPMMEGGANQPRGDYSMRGRFNPQGPSSFEDESNRQGGYQRGFRGNQQGGRPGSQVNQQLLAYLEKNYKGEAFLLATESSQEAGSIMLHTNYAVMAMGGFSGSDPALTPTKLETMVKAGKVKYFLITDRGRGNQDITAWIQKNCKEVPSSEWQSSQQTENQPPIGMNQTQKLYEYKG